MTKLTNKKVQEIINKEMPGYVLDTKNDDNIRTTNLPNIDRSARDLDYLKQKFFGKQESKIKTTDQGKAKVVKNGKIIAEQG